MKERGKDKTRKKRHGEKKKGAQGQEKTKIRN